MKNKCDKCGRTSSAYDMDDCPFCKEEREKELDIPTFIRKGIKIEPAVRVKKDSPNGETFEDEKFDYHPLAGENN